MEKSRGRFLVSSPLEYHAQLQGVNLLGLPLGLRGTISGGSVNLYRCALSSSRRLDLPARAAPFIIAGDLRLGLDTRPLDAGAVLPAEVPGGCLDDIDGRSYSWAHMVN